MLETESSHFPFQFSLPISDALSFVIFHYETLLFFDEFIHSFDSFFSL